MNVPLMYQYIPFLPPIHLILKAGYKFTLAGKNINIYAYIYILYIYICMCGGFQSHGGIPRSSIYRWDFP